METLGFVILWILFFVFLFSSILIFIWAITLFKNKTPFIPVSIDALPEIYKALDLKDDSIVYDLGSGDGRVLQYISKQNSQIRVFGIENNIFALIISKINFIFLNKKQKKNIKIIRNNFFKEDLSFATHLVSYIYPNVMDDLLPKFDKELKRGVRLVSVNYHFTNKKPILEIELKRSKYRLSRKLYVYEF